MRKKKFFTEKNSHSFSSSSISAILFIFVTFFFFFYYWFSGALAFTFVLTIFFIIFIYLDSDHPGCLHGIDSSRERQRTHGPGCRAVMLNGLDMGMRARMDCRGFSWREKKRATLSAFQESPTKRYISTEKLFC